MEDDVAGTLRAEGENRPSRPSHAIAFAQNQLGEVLERTRQVPIRVHGEHSTAMTGNGTARVADEVEVARTLDTCGGYATNQGGNLVMAEHLSVVAPAGIRATFAKTHKPMSSTDFEGWSPTDMTPTITHWSRDRSDNGTDVAVVQSVVAFAQNSRDEVRLMGGDGQLSGTLSAEPGSHMTTFLAASHFDVYNHRLTGDTTGVVREQHGTNMNAVFQTVAFTENHEGRVYEHDQIGALNQGGGKPGMCYPAVRTNMTVRRLTPVECERLQGFPDGHTRIPYRGRPAEECPDSSRYKALGNSMAVPVMNFVGRRLDAVRRGLGPSLADVPDPGDVFDLFGE